MKPTIKVKAKPTLVLKKKPKPTIILKKKVQPNKTKGSKYV